MCVYVPAGSLLGGLAEVDSISKGFKQKVNSSSRARRQSNQDEIFNIEVLLGVDCSVVQFHGREHIQKYLLTLMNIVSPPRHFFFSPQATSACSLLFPSRNLTWKAVDVVERSFAPACPENYQDKPVQVTALPVILIYHMK